MTYTPGPNETVEQILNNNQWFTFDSSDSESYENARNAINADSIYAESLQHANALDGGFLYKIRRSGFFIPLANSGKNLKKIIIKKASWTTAPPTGFLFEWFATDGAIVNADFSNFGRQISTEATIYGQDVVLELNALGRVYAGQNGLSFMLRHSGDVGNVIPTETLNYTGIFTTKLYGVYEDIGDIEFIEQTGETDKNLVDGPIFVDTEDGPKSFDQILDEADEITYSDEAETNISSFILKGVTYSTFAPITVEVSEITGLQISGGQAVLVEGYECGRNKSGMLKFKNQFGVWEYLPIFHKTTLKPNISGGDRLQFEDGYFVVNSELTNTIDVEIDNYPIENLPIVKEFEKNQNVWAAINWQYSDFSASITSEAAIDGTLGTTERLVRFPINSVEIHESIIKNFVVGEKVHFETVATPYTLLGMYGTIVEISQNSVIVKFSETDENEDLSTLDTWVSGGTELRLVRWEKWVLCSAKNTGSYTTSDGSIYMQIRLETNPETNYSI